MSELVDDLARIVRDAGFDARTFLGSLSRAVDDGAALEHARMFERMILVNTFRTSSSARVSTSACLLLAPAVPFMKAHRTRTARHVLFSEDVSEEDQRLFRERTRFVAQEGYVSRMRIIRDTDLRPRLKEIEAPALVVAGTADRLLDSVRAARLMVERLPRARLKLLEDTGHVALLSERVRVRDWLGEFDEF